MFYLTTQFPSLCQNDGRGDSLDTPLFGNNARIIRLAKKLTQKQFTS